MLETGEKLSTPLHHGSWSSPLQNIPQMGCETAANLKENKTHSKQMRDVKMKMCFLPPNSTFKWA